MSHFCLAYYVLATSEAEPPRPDTRARCFALVGPVFQGLQFCIFKCDGGSLRQRRLLKLPS